MLQPANHQLAQLNIGRIRYEISDARMAGFADNLQMVNRLAERTPGFVWRYIDESGNSTATRPYADPRVAINLSVWESVETLEHFVFNTVHRTFYERRAEWFEVLGRMHFVMWWVPAGHRPTLDEALERLKHLEAHGDSDQAFGWKYLKEAQAWKTRGCAQVAAE